MMMECYRRDPTNKKPCLCLLDGERQLWKLAEEWFPGAIGILDLFHALKRLWDVAHCLYAQESAEAGEFVTHHLRMLLQGKVSYVLRNFRPWLRTLKGANKKTVQSAITYYENNQQHMRYDEYLAAGYPIASGVAEGACKHLVKDRMDVPGCVGSWKGLKQRSHCGPSTSMAFGISSSPTALRQNRSVCMGKTRSLQRLHKSGLRVAAPPASYFTRSRAS